MLSYLTSTIRLIPQQEDVSHNMKAKFFLTSFLILVSIAIIFSGCNKHSVTPVSPEQQLANQLAVVDPTQLAADLKTIDDSLTRWNITALHDPQGVRYTVQTEGTGVTPTLSNYVVINYKVKLLKNKSVIDQGTNITFPLADLIIGWKTTLPLIKVGSKITMYVPSGFAYGAYERIDPIDRTVIMPANSNLIFEIDLLGVQ